LYFKVKVRFRVRVKVRVRFIVKVRARVEVRVSGNTFKYIFDQTSNRARERSNII